jgi:hypothetical protein
VSHFVGLGLVPGLGGGSSLHALGLGYGIGLFVFDRAGLSVLSISVCLCRVCLRFVFCPPLFTLSVLLVCIALLVFGLCL